MPGTVEVALTVREAALALVGIASHLGDSVQQWAVLSQAAEILSTQSRQLQENGQRTLGSVPLPADT